MTFDTRDSLNDGKDTNADVEGVSDTQVSLACTQPAELTDMRASLTMSIGELEHALLTRFPASDAESWDRTGMLVGDPTRRVRAVACALDPAPRAIAAAALCGANVLVCHHPLFLDPPTKFYPATSTSIADGSAVWAAIEHGVAVMSFHTALDVSSAAAHVLPDMLGLVYQDIVDKETPDGMRGYGQLCTISPNESMTLGRLASRCVAVFGQQPRVWGDLDTPLTRVVTCTGATGDLVDRCVVEGYDCLVCGEVKYHAALPARDAGLSIIDLGHDTSELPLAALLAKEVARIGVPEESIRLIDQSGNWTHLEASRR